MDEKNSPKDRILIVDDDTNILKLYEIGLRGFEVLTAKSAEQAEEMISKHGLPDCFVLDYKLPGSSGLELLTKLKKKDSDVPVIMLTGNGSQNIAVKATLQGANSYISKPVALRDLKQIIKVHIESYQRGRELKKINEELEENNRQMKLDILRLYSALDKAVEQKDEYTAGHSKRVGQYGWTIGKEIGLTLEQLRNIYCGSMIHDIGKIGIPDSILLKPDKLTDDEFRQIKEHPGRGYTIIKDNKKLEPLHDIVKHHHERFDGNGYPDRLKGDDIPVEVRIVSAADAIDAMTSKRAYREAQNWEFCYEQIEKGSGTQFDPKVAETAMEMIGRKIKNN